MSGRVSRAVPILIAAASMLLVLLIIVPVPTWVLDILLTFNIMIALLIIGTALFAENALAFSVFPTLLLIITLFRLSLNVTATRWILSNGSAGTDAAGDVIKFFGEIVIGGNYAVGFVIFLILVIIQFVVITNGAGRVAEVAARFTLDAMPGKQLAIDADLNAGLITEAEARQRRKDIQRSADFYGAMDGASKFVRGDAIAAGIIVAINTLGGFVVGIVHAANFQTVLGTYTLLTVGEGIVTQIPALLISTATGIIVTRAASENDFGSDLTKQLSGQPNAILVAAIMATIFGLFGLARWLMFAAAAGMFVFYAFRRRALATAGGPGMLSGGGGAAAIAGGPAAPAKPAESVVPLLSYDPMELEIGFGLIPLVDVNQGGDLLERITLIRRHAARDLGIVVPPIRVRDNLQLKPNAYVVKIYGLEVATADVMVSRLLAMNPGTATAAIDGIATTEPAFGLPALWIPDTGKPEAEMAGYTVIDPTSVIATHLTELIKGHAPDLLGRQETSALLDNVKQHYPVVVEELVPQLLTVGEIQRVLQNLLRERIPIRNLILILETLADAARVSKDIDYLTERVRSSLARHISAEYAEDGLLSVITVDPRLESLLAEAVRRGEDAYALLDPNTVARIYSSLAKQIAIAQSSGLAPIVLASPSVRLALKRLTERAAPQLVVLAYSEIAPGLRVESIGQISATDDDGREPTAPPGEMSARS